MTWNTPPTWSSGDMVTDTQLNTLSGNLLETSTAKATASGNYTVSTGPFALAERVIGFDSIPTSETTSNTSFTNLATTGCTVPVTSGARCIGFHTAKMANDTAGGQCYSSLDISGATTVSATDNLSLQFTSAIANASNEASYVVVYAMTSGSNTFTMKYRVNTGTGTFLYRRCTIMPF